MLSGLRRTRRQNSYRPAQAASGSVSRICIRDTRPAPLGKACKRARSVPGRAWPIHCSESKRSFGMRLSWTIPPAHPKAGWQAGQTTHREPRPRVSAEGRSAGRLSAQA